MACEFVNELSRLKKSSAESVDNTGEFDEFNKYMHVTRKIENELRARLKDINDSNSKCLLLLCGSAGDGKSHLLSYLKNGDQLNEGLLKDFIVLNDATESDAPSKTAMETLAERLYEYSDDRLGVGNQKTVLAINLGILNKFIESDYGEKFKQLRKYVENNGILIGKSSSEYNQGSYFQHITFSDYQMFTIKNSEVETAYLDHLFEKVFNDKEDNPFNNSYLHAVKTCNCCKQCPIRHNFELLKEEKYRKAVIFRIVEVILKDKILISTRDVFDLMFNVIVAPDYHHDEYSIKTDNWLNFLSSYVSSALPQLLDEYKDVSNLQNYIKKYDVLKTRSDQMDSEAIYFNTIVNVMPNFKKTIEGTPYEEIIPILEYENCNLKNGELKTNVFKFMKRLDCLLDYELDDNVSEFIKFIYCSNKGDYKPIKKLYKLVCNAIKKWNGYYDNDYICFDNSSNHYWLLEKIDIRPYIDENFEKDVKDEIYRFNPSINLKFRCGTNKNIVSIDIDFNLFKLLKDIENGYKINASDKNYHADFNGFVNKVVAYGNQSEEIMLVSKSDPTVRIIVKRDDFGTIEVKR